MNKKTIKQSGFTLIEILIAAFIFTVVVGAVTVIFASNNNIKSQTKVIRDTTQSARYALEAITRSVQGSQASRGFKINPTGIQEAACGTTPCLVVYGDTNDYQYFLDTSSNQLMMKTYNRSCSAPTTCSVGLGTTQPVTNQSDILIKSFDISGIGSKDNDTSNQPYATIKITYQSPNTEGKQSEQLGGEQTLQTTVTVDSLSN